LLFLSAAAPAQPQSSLPIELALALKKPSKTLTVGIEYAGDTASSGAFDMLSMQLRKRQVSTIWTSDLVAAAEFVREQKTAIGNFPGPCPVIFNGGLEQIGAAVEVGVSAVVVKVSTAASEEQVSGILDNLAEKQVGVIYEIESSDNVQIILDRHGGQQTIAFLIDANSDQLEDAVGGISGSSQDSIIIASLPAMQDDNAEIATARSLKLQGVHSIVLEKAVMGDAEDIEYATFAVNGLTQKKSSSFNMSGLTGSTNGHFGGVGSSVAKTWKRIVYAKAQKDAKQ
jgi:hypothetical protein